MAEANAVIAEERLNRLWLEGEELVGKWEPLVKEYVVCSVGLHPWNCDEKTHDEKGHLINIRTFDGDDDLFSDYGDFEREFFAWNERVKSWLSNMPLRFQHRFDEVFAKTERFSKQFDNQYSFVGDVPDLLALYDDFCKKQAAVRDLNEKLGSNGWSFKEDDDIAFELRYNEIAGDLFVNEYKICRFNLDSELEVALAKALSRHNEAHKVDMDASGLQSNIGMLRIPRELRKLMIRTSKKSLVIKPRITYGDLKSAGLNDAKIIEEFEQNLAKIVQKN